MSLRVQKRWVQLGAPTQPGTHNVPNLGKVVDVTEEQLQQVAQLGGDPVVVLEAVSSSGLVARWRVIEMRAE